MSKRTRSLLVFAAKVLVAGVLITLLVRSKSLDFGALAVIVKSPTLFVGNLLTWIFSGIVFSTMRWKFLLRIPGARISTGRATMLQFVAVFFNVVIPGNVGGDVIKNLYVARDEPPEKRTTIVLLAFVERFLGLAGLIAFCGLVTLVRFGSLWSDPAFRPMIATVGLLVLATLVGPALGILVVRKWGDRIEARIGGGTSFVARMARQLVASARLVASGPGWLFGALLASMGTHVTGLSLFVALTRAITHQDVAYGQIGTIYPIGVLSLVLPISPAGFGVGHVAFDRLFDAVGLAGGATVFNVFILGQMAPSVLGVIPYLAMRRSLPKEAPPA